MNLDHEIKILVKSTCIKTASLLSLCVKAGGIWFTAVVADGEKLLHSTAGRNIRWLPARRYLYHHVTPALQLTLAESTPPLLNRSEGCGDTNLHYSPSANLFIKYYT
jgi:hypothetical protein